MPLLAGRRGKLAAGTSRSHFAADLRTVLAERDFRRLFATRLISQTGDGVFTAGLAAYVFFSAQIFPNPLAAAEAFAVLYLPYSLVGPFAGVFIDRWSAPPDPALVGADPRRLRRRDRVLHRRRAPWACRSTWPRSPCSA